MFQDVPIDFLVVYRIGFGLVMCWWAVEYLRFGVPFYNYTIAPYQFSYYGFEWIKPWEFSLSIGGLTYDGMTLHFIALAILSLMITFGVWFRAAALLFGLGYAYWFLLDKCFYLNHYYLGTILSLMMPLLPANRAFSIDAWKRPGIRSETVPQWTLWLLRFQFGIPYFFGGIAKINFDWLRGQPMRTTLSYMTEHPWVANFPFDREVMVQFICWGGLVFDLAIVPLLLFRRTRVFGYVLACMFHLSNHFLWNIGIFPWLMIVATTVYFDPDWPRRLLRRPRGNVRDSSLPAQVTLRQRLVVGALCIWVSIQALVPLRVYVLPGNPSWSEYTHHFSWHMLLRAKMTGLRVYGTDPHTGRSGTIDLRDYMTQRQLRVVGRDPRMIHQLCMFISQDLERKGYQDVELRVLALASLNGRKPQLLIDPTVDLAKEPRDLSYPDWIVDLHEPYRHDAWNYPMDQWEEHLDLNLPPQMQLTPVTTQVAQAGGVSNTVAQARPRADN
ncbi:MAG: HTTM domain-containing protein [Aureliella sp.]